MGKGAHIFFFPRANKRLLKFDFANFTGTRNMIGFGQASFCTGFSRDLTHSSARSLLAYMNDKGHLRKTN